MIFLSSTKVTMVTEAASDKCEYGLRILARMIARAYLGETGRGATRPDVYRDEFRSRDGDVEPSKDSQIPPSDK